MKKLVFLVLLFETSLIWAGGETLVEPPDLSRHHKVTPLVFRFDADTLCESGGANCDVAQNEVKGDLIQEAIDDWNGVFNTAGACLAGGAGIGQFHLSGGSKFKIELDDWGSSATSSPKRLKGYNTIYSMSSATSFFDDKSGGVIDNKSGEVLEYNIVLPKNIPAGTAAERAQYKAMVLRKIGQAIGLSQSNIAGTGNLPCSRQAKKVGEVTDGRCLHSSRGANEIMATSTAVTILRPGDKNAACLIYGGFFTGATPTSINLYERYESVPFSSSTNSQRFKFDVPEDMDHKFLTVEVITNVGDQVQLDGTLTYPSGYFDFLKSDRTGAIRKILPAYAGTYMLEVNNPSGTPTNSDKPMVLRAFLTDAIVMKEMMKKLVYLDNKELLKMNLR